MNSSGIPSTHVNSTRPFLPAAFEASLSKSGQHSARSSCSSELSSHWNFAGRLSCDLHKPTKVYARCVQDPEQRHCTVECLHNVKDKRSSQPMEKVPPAFPITLSSRLRGWLAQLLNASVNRDDKMKPDSASAKSQPGEFEAFVLDYELEKGIDPLQSYIMQPFKCAGSSSPGVEQPQDTSLSPIALAEVAINDLVSAIPSINVLSTLPYFDILHSNLVQAPGCSEYSMEEKNKSMECFEKSQEVDVQSERLVSPDELGSPDALASWLSDRLPSGISQWGTVPGTKRVTNLWIELKEGEIVLEDAHPPRRMVHVASVKIRNKAGHLLVEAHQEMADGSIRPRNRPLSEKMRPGENVEDACLRGIFEELGSQLGARNRVRILVGSYQRKKEERESLSYPGLLTSYIVHSVDAIIDDLPETGFYTVEDEIVGHKTLESGALPCQASRSLCNGLAVGVKKHFWRWEHQPT